MDLDNVSTRMGFKQEIIMFEKFNADILPSPFSSEFKRNITAL